MLPSSKVLVAGGQDDSFSISTCEIYDPIAGAWNATGSMSQRRSYHTATLLPNGKVLIAGGLLQDVSPIYLSTCEIYDPVTGSWLATSSMSQSRYMHTATLLSNGKVLVSGGSPGNISTCELYDPVSAVFQFPWTLTKTYSCSSIAEKCLSKVRIVALFSLAKIAE